MQPLLLWKSNGYCTTWVCICSFRYPACNAHAPYCHLWPAQHYNIFPHYPINGKIFEKKKLFNTKCVFRFSIQVLTGIFFILRWTERDDRKCISVCMYSTVMYIGLHVQYRYVYRTACTVPLYISDCMYSAVMYIGLHVEYRYVYRTACTVPLCISVCM